jgi:hypothetical protein
LPFWILKLALPFIQLQSRLTGGAPVFTREALAALKSGHPDMRSDKAQRELGHTFRPLEESISDFYKWQKQKKVII